MPDLPLTAAADPGDAGRAADAGVPADELHPPRLSTFVEATYPPQVREAYAVHVRVPDELGRLRCATVRRC